MIERKVSAPALVGLAAAILALLVAFGVDLTQDQQKAILGVVLAALPVVHFLVGYVAPHTARPDLGVHEIVGADEHHDGGYATDGLLTTVLLVVLVVLALYGLYVLV